jgi:hypothetical protein
MFRSKYLLLCAFCAVLSACPFEDLTPTLEKAEYGSNRSITVMLLVPDASVAYEVNDDTLSVYSTKHNLYYRIAGTEKLSGAEYQCTLRRDLKPGDRVRVNGHGSLAGSVCFDVPGEEQL